VGYLNTEVEPSSSATLKPPGITCPNIDKVQRGLRRLHWRARNPGKKDDANEILRDSLILLEKVRAENAKMRKAFYEMKERLKKAGML